MHFLYRTISMFSLLSRLNQLNRDKTIVYLMQSRSFDGGFRSIAGAETHIMQVHTVFMCTAVLAILDGLVIINLPTLG
ncbi:hypothetical protein HETIRDRAFT_419734 [Heterobasidion irregulare TC 32-1]|uniref:Prenyltransferase alpha-alpha toroid domain-containing protein n=1 Tax=Heterobasidion irregulare (strain TC 32-1) TaxID=747525 RepID=W4K2X0_HETIT|nr:uncharacterized protein HETIRDRAFT_419734 [Heterobasidion irregulare TC 32-1]ETW80162.1 hypothetical protein HETIRDRAFT_419734 [Heterobasidion irregulare TC 32-1]